MSWQMRKTECRNLQFPNCEHGGTTHHFLIFDGTSSGRRWADSICNLGPGLDYDFSYSDILLLCSALDLLVPEAWILRRSLQSSWIQ